MATIEYSIAAANPIISGERAVLLASKTAQAKQISFNRIGFVGEEISVKVMSKKRRQTLRTSQDDAKRQSSTRN